MVWVLAFDRLTVKGKAVVPGGVLLVVPSGLTTSSMESAGWVSSFWIVPVPVPLAIVALVAADRVTVKVSSGSNVVSALTGTVIVLLVSAGAKVSVPFGRRYSLPAVVVDPAAVVQLAVAVSQAAFDGLDRP